MYIRKYKHKGWVIDEEFILLKLSLNLQLNV